MRFSWKVLGLRFIIVVTYTLATQNLVAVPAGAQTAASPLEEIVVTARKRAEISWEVPFAIDAYDQELITKAGARGIFELARLSPNLSFRPSFGRTLDRPAIRGQSIVRGENTVGLFVDGVFVAGSLSSTPLDNIERVEVLKGPQSALFGRATLAGAINYVSRKPGNEWFGKLAVTGAEHDEYEARAYISGPIIQDDLAFDIGTRVYTYGGEYTNVGPGGGVIGQEETNGGSGSLFWTPGDKFSALLRLTYFEDNDGHPTNWLEIQADELNCFEGVARGYYCGEVEASEAVAIDLFPKNKYGIERQTFRGSLTMDWQLDFATLTAISSITNEEEDWLLDFGPQISIGPFAQSTMLVNWAWDTWSQELRLASSSQGRMRWLVGGYYYDGKKIDPTDINIEDIENVAVFGSIDWDVTETLTAAVELRWAEDDKSVTGINGSLDENFDSITPRFSLRWRFADSSQVYLSAALGTKPGGFNQGLLAADVPAAERQRLGRFLAYDEEEAWNYEIGSKLNLLRDRLQLELAAFYIDWSDQQLTRSEAFIDSLGMADSIPLITNLGQTEIYGGELTALWQLTDGLALSLAYGYTDVEIVQACDVEYGAFFGEDAECLSLLGERGGGSLKGNKTPNVPEHTLAISVDYSRALNRDFDWYVRADYNFESTRYAQVFNLAETGDANRVNLRMGVENDYWTLSAWVKNLTNDDTVDSVLRIVDFNRFFTRRAFQAHLPRGRQLGVTAEYRFGVRH